jgi:hypothetical protein
MHQSLQMMASACCSISGLTAVTDGLSEGNHRAPLFLFQKPSVFCPATSGASVDHSTSLNIAKTFVDVSHLFFLSSKVFCHSTLFVPLIIG